MPNRPAKWLSAALLISAAFLSIGWGQSWESIRTAGDKISSIRAEFTQEKHMPILQKPLVSEGVLYFQLPDSLRWEYTRPIRSILLRHNGTTRRFVQTRGKVLEESGRQLEMMQFMLREIPLWLGGRFNDNPLFSAELQEGGRIEMRPREAAMAEIIERVQVQLSPTPGVIESVTVYEGEAVFTRFLFADVALNESLEESLFRAADR